MVCYHYTVRQCTVALMYGRSYVLSLFYCMYCILYIVQRPIHFRAKVVYSARRKRFSALKKKLSLFREFLKLTFEMFLSAPQYRHPISVTTYICTHPYYTYTSSSSYSLLNHMARCRVALERPSACEATVIQEVQVGTIEQRQNIESALPGLEPECIRLYTSNVIRVSDRLCAVFDWAIIIKELFSSNEEQNARKIF